MSKLTLKSAIIAAVALAVPMSASANDEVRALNDNPNYWAFPGGDYNNTRFSKLKQINNENVNKIVAAWTFSTGRLQGHDVVIPDRLERQPIREEPLPEPDQRRLAADRISELRLARGERLLDRVRHEARDVGRERRALFRDLALLGVQGCLEAGLVPGAAHGCGLARGVGGSRGRGQEGQALHRGRAPERAARALRGASPLDHRGP